MSYLQDEIRAHRRMRACLVGIVPLDPPGVAARIAEVDGMIAQLEASMPQAEPLPVSHGGRIEVVPIRRSLVRAA